MKEPVERFLSHREVIELAVQGILGREGWAKVDVKWEWLHHREKDGSITLDAVKFSFTDIEMKK